MKKAQKKVSSTKKPVGKKTPATNKYPLNWDLSPLFKSENDPAVTTKLAKAKTTHLAFIKKWQTREDWLSEPKVLLQAFNELEKLTKEGGLTAGWGYYLSLASSLNQNSKTLKAKMGQLKDFALPIENELEFFSNKLSKIPAADQAKLLSAPELKDYTHFLKNLFENGKHTLTIAEEKIMNLKAAPAGYYWERMTSNLLAAETVEVKNETGQKAEVNMAQLISLTASPKKAVRDGAAKAVNTLMQKYAPIAEHEINAILDNKKVNDDLRGFTRPDQARHLAGDIDSKVVDAMLKAVSADFDIPQKFYQLKTKLLKVKKLEYHERNVPIGSLQSKWSYDKAVEMVKDSLSSVDSEFGRIFMDFVNNKQIDVYSKPNKSAGAFCAHDLPQNPTYILLNHNDTLNDVLTLAHEVGHGINNELIKKAQPSHYFDTPLSTAEVASTFMEDFVLADLGKEVTDEERLALYMMKLNDDVSTIFRQVACYSFEQQLHQQFRERGYLNKEDIGRIFETEMKKYMGPAINYYEGSENWWVYWSHIRRFFYVYSYASGLLISKALQAKTRADKNFVPKVKYFLSAGTSDSPANIFRNIGIDITDPKFWQTGLKEIRDLLEETTKLAKKLKKI
jgi:oligoendopeptidase F